VFAASALACQPHGLPVGHAGGNLEINVLPVHIEAHRAATGRRFKGNGDLRRLFGSRRPRGTAALAARTATRTVAEIAKSRTKIAQDLFKFRRYPRSTGARSAAAPMKGCAARKTLACRTGAGEAKAVVLLAFLFVAQYVVGVLHFFEARFRLLI